MLALKSAGAALLAALVLGVLTPSLLYQDAGPGKPDDVAQLLPEETIAFVELVKAPRLLHDWKEYVGSFTSPEGRDKACAFIEEFFTKALEIVPEKLLKDLKAGLPTIQRMAVALTGPIDLSAETPWVVIATSSDPALFKKLVEEDMAVFAGEEKAHNGVKVFAIRKLGDLKSEFPYFVAAPGGKLVLSTRWENVTDAIDRAAGRGTGNDLRKNAQYAQLAPAPSDDPALRAFARWDWDSLMGGTSNRRFGQLMMDMIDATLGFRKLKGATVEATFKPGQVVSTMRMPVDPGCRIYDTFRQSAGPKDLLVHLPKNTMLFAHQNLKGGKEVWGDIEVFMRRYQEAEKKLWPGRERGDNLAEFTRHVKKELGFEPADLAAAVGNEILVAMTEGGDAPNPGQMFVVLFRTTDAAKMRELMEKVAEKSGKYASSTEDKVTLYKRADAGHPCFGIRDTTVAFGLSEALVKESLASNEDTSGASKRLPKDAASASGIFVVNPARLVDMILKLSGTEEPEPLTHMRADAWSVTLFRTEKEAATITSTDAGYGAALQTTFAGLPLLAMGFARMFMMPFDGPGMVPPTPPVKVEPEPPAVPAAELGKRVTEQVALLRSEELSVREKASADLKALGRQAVPLLVAAYKSEKDPEARSRLTSLLVHHNAWDVMPELLDHKVDAFFDEFRASLETRDDREFWGAYATWNAPDSAEPFSIEPHEQPAYLARFKNADILSNPVAMKRLVERLRKADLPAAKRAQFAALLAFHDCGPASEAVMQLRDTVTDAESRGYLTIALGWADDAKAKEAVYRSLESKEITIRRSAFLAAERSREPEIVTRLLDRAKDTDFETRWNAGYTLRALTGGKIELNAFLPDTEYEAQILAGRKWWEGAKASFKLKASSSKPK